MVKCLQRKMIALALCCLNIGSGVFTPGFLPTAVAQSSPQTEARTGPRSIEAGNCKISVRVLVAKRDSATSENKLNISSFAPEMGEQLEGLPFKDYQQLEFKHSQTDFSVPANFEFSGQNGSRHQLAITPRSASGGKVQISINWSDQTALLENRGNATVLKTNMRVPNGESVVVGTDTALADPVVLGLQIYCSK